MLATTFTPIKTRLEHLAARRLRPDGPATEIVQPRSEAASPSIDDAVLARLEPRLEAIARRAVDEALRERGPDLRGGR